MNDQEWVTPYQSTKCFTIARFPIEAASIKGSQPRIPSRVRGPMVEKEPNDTNITVAYCKEKNSVSLVIVCVDWDVINEVESEDEHRLFGSGSEQEDAGIRDNAVGYRKWTGFEEVHSMKLATLTNVRTRNGGI
ncbi:hypothetical protein DL96DRAFT_1560983 [Flagelloscypha sp. PMI_526]|nr:hypothetical protein DL96DRAFT_1560983 [Flagelloscypha sp. PMI_526]